MKRKRYKLTLNRNIFDDRIISTTSQKRKFVEFPKRIERSQEESIAESIADAHEAIKNQHQKIQKSGTGGSGEGFEWRSGSSASGTS